MEPLTLDPSLLPAFSLSRFSSTDLLVTPNQSPRVSTPRLSTPISNFISTLQLNSTLSPTAEENEPSEGSQLDCETSGQDNLGMEQSEGLKRLSSGACETGELADDPESLVFGTTPRTSVSPRPEVDVGMAQVKPESPRSPSSLLGHHTADSPQPSVQSSHRSHDSSPFDPSDVGSESQSLCGLGPLEMDWADRIPGEDAKKELKRARNRDAARQSRAKKKRMVQNIKETKEDLETKNSELQKENEALKSTNSALEKQLAFFQGLFRKTFERNGPSLPSTSPLALQDQPAETLTTTAIMDAAAKAASEIGTAVVGREGVSSPGNGSLAMGLVFLMAFSAVQLEDAGTLPPPVEFPGVQPQQGFRGRALLSVESFEEAQFDVFSAFRGDHAMLAQVVNVRLWTWASTFGLFVMIIFRFVHWMVGRQSFKTDLPRSLPTATKPEINKVHWDRADGFNN